MFEELKKFESRNKKPDYIYKMNIFVTLVLSSGLIAWSKVRVHTRAI